MNWHHFILLLTGIYLGYYAVNIVADLYLKKTPVRKTLDQDVLFFSEDAQPEIILYDDSPEPLVTTNDQLPNGLALEGQPSAYPAPVIEATGAVSLREIIQVAQAGLVQYTKAIPY
ncbi:hypothetical protein [Mucilaginibacter lacusdianchii]|uniref:hypothetical protein n=1 Tax=Mucilaginibacter lacusdianchii TaxID=2684211 RepID=UPI00131E9BCF|nr:hypothetical protein [Mucilaginibacter sp. JXJ CY 39]